MTLAVADSGTTSALTIGTETDLVTYTPATSADYASYALRIDANALAAGEAFNVTAYAKTGWSGVTNIKEDIWRLTGGDAVLVLLTHPVPTDTYLRFTVKQLNGTGRTFPWKTFKV